MNQSTNTRNTSVAVISASWHADIVNQASTTIETELKLTGTDVLVEHIRVPGAYEIPLHAKLLAQTGRYDAIIACALVVDGGIYRHDFVAQAVVDGLMRAQLDTEVPVFSVVLTPHHFHEHDEHLQYFREHFVKKGREAARACQETLTSLRAITG
ncbi:MAG: 6,7-dimethyl-8-ribityllumazine synthase [Natronospirillum sp.]|uniref:6,7-dimethyl-8-ribityllumazine synthase n=1 Tax=Natronospirillum sp. TaxID=2812955 RepID=UPI0025CEAF9B|nr:6,7-dimethyl-8-ribityllumazine synthase [Natronospirillum sp.]MCH8550864.1 6,7-dimethyl-8-ribityllumazine synthase [Natronospirillum sp.]